jgi:hypothetical protein
METAEMTKEAEMIKRIIGTVSESDPPEDIATEIPFKAMLRLAVERWMLNYDVELSEEHIKSLMRLIAHFSGIGFPYEAWAALPDGGNRNPDDVAYDYDQWARKYAPAKVQDID